jgi:hypothetical protein
MTRIAWRRLDVPGLEWADIDRGADDRWHWRAVGRAA